MRQDGDFFRPENLGTCPSPEGFRGNNVFLGRGLKPARRLVGWVLSQTGSEVWAGSEPDVGRIGARRGPGLGEGLPPLLVADAVLGEAQGAQQGGEALDHGRGAAQETQRALAHTLLQLSL